MIMPGVQMPHCAPPCSTKARCNGCRPASPSIVVTRVPPTCITGTRHEFTGTPSTSTVQAPHSPSPQPSFVPGNAQSSRKTSSNRFIGCARTRTRRAFNVNDTDDTVVTDDGATDSSRSVPLCPSCPSRPLCLCALCNALCPRRVHHLLGGRRYLVQRI